ncbi:MAG: hypothetical protein AB7P07_12130 [Hyphomonadaceae bacterium]
MPRDMKAEGEMIRKILLTEWNPIGAGATAEQYEFFVWPIQKRLMSGVPGEALAKYLKWGADELVGKPVPEAKVQRTVQQLLALKLADTEPKYRS